MHSSIQSSSNYKCLQLNNFEWDRIQLNFSNMISEVSYPLRSAVYVFVYTFFKVVPVVHETSVNRESDKS